MTPERLLRAHVMNSHRIEGAAISRRSAEFRRHLQAAQYVCSEAKNAVIVGPVRLQGALMPFRYSYRTSQLAFDGRAAPTADRVPLLMEEWWKTVQQYGWMLPAEPSGDWHDWAERRSWVLHDWLMCIYPFDRGTGLVARLVLNSMRLRAGLPWRIVPYGRRYNYLRQIGEFDRTSFRSWYPNATMMPCA